jgi:gem associated protein 5
MGVACGDGSLRSLDVGPTSGVSGGGNGGGGGALLWRGLPQTKVTCMAWHPVDPENGAGGGVVAAGLEDGRVVLVDTLVAGACTRPLLSST